MKIRINGKQYRATKRTATICALALLVIMCTCGIFNVLGHIEMYDQTAKYQLMLSLENGDPDAMEYYQHTYTDKDIYLFDGPISRQIVADKYGYTIDQINHMYYMSDYSSLTDFVKNVLK